MKSKLSKILVILFSISCILTAFNYTANADTDGTEMKILQAQQLEVQLGTAWAGVEFQLRTDAGLYPGTVKVGDDGVLRMEIGGSKSYVLSCLNSDVSIPLPVETYLSEESSDAFYSSNPVDVIETSQDINQGAEEKNDKNSEKQARILLIIGIIIVFAMNIIIFSMIREKHKKKRGLSNYDKQQN